MHEYYINFNLQKSFQNKTIENEILYFHVKFIVLCFDWKQWNFKCFSFVVCVERYGTEFHFLSFVFSNAYYLPIT